MEIPIPSSRKSHIGINKFLDDPNVPGDTILFGVNPDNGEEFETTKDNVFRLIYEVLANLAPDDDVVFDSDEE